MADLRVACARRRPDRAATELVRELRLASREFAQLWERHDVSATLHCSTKVVHNARVGRIDLDCVLVTSPRWAQRLVLLQPAPGTVRPAWSGSRG